MSVPKLEQLSKSVVQGPSLATGAVPAMDWMDIPVVFKPGNYAFPARKDKVEYLNSQKGLHFPNARDWSPEDDDWKLPENWIVITGGDGLSFGQQNRPFRNEKRRKLFKFRHQIFQAFRSGRAFDHFFRKIRR